MSEQSAIALTPPLEDETVCRLRAGQSVRISGKIYTMRDAAHARLLESMRGGAPAPFELRGAVIYYTGPAPAPPGKVTGPMGPTTSMRMDPFTPELLKAGVRLLIGKGPRSTQVADALRTHSAAYCVATGGAAVLLAQAVKAVKIVAFEDLMSEAVRELTVEGFPVTVAVDCHGGDLFRTGPEEARRTMSSD